jgi:uncharacterized protein
MIPDILKNIMDNLPSFTSNTNELKSIWKSYLYVLESEFPEILIDHGGDSVYLGQLSPGCVLCKNGEWDCLFIASACNLYCEFCISPFRPGSKIPISAYGETDRELIKNFKSAGIEGISFSGGEPFLDFPGMITRLNTLKKELPDYYYWLYTNGTLVKKAHIDILADSGINEIRYNTAATGYNDKRILKIIEYTAKKIENTTVEIPVIFKDKKILLAAITDYTHAGVKYLNLHELMKENDTPSEHLRNENFKKFTFEDGHTTEISLDSKFTVNEIIRKIVDADIELNLNFCSTVNKLRQIRKRRQNMIKLLKGPHEKMVEEEYLETIFIFKDKDTFQFIHPDVWRSERTKYVNYCGFTVIKIAPLSVYSKAHYISVQKL